ncbi:hypothetical protein [Sandarakinorhabdus sp.]|uniref:hypothetical protein n=1 Tax=Sandarakinorhabdus sp. TaxID=1916663 RepID=UPI00333FA05D
MRNFSTFALRTALLAAALAPAMAMAADFSGSWVRDQARSKPAPHPNYWITRAAPGGGGGNNNAFVVRVEQSASDVKIIHPVLPQRTLMLDGKARTAPAYTGLVPATTSAAMAGESLKVTMVQPFGGMPGNVTMTATETWSLSADGKELTIDVVREMPATTQRFSEVFKRQ